METKKIERDIVVIGGGTAGSAAAVAAARRGHSVLLVEEGNCLGGVSSGGNVAQWYAGLDGMGDIFSSIIRIMDNFGARTNVFYNPYSPEYLKIAWQLLAQDAGVEILFHTTLQDVITRGKIIKGVRLVSCSQTIDVSAKFFIDASGEGDLGFLAGAQFMQGDPLKGRTLHMTLVFFLCDTGKPVKVYLPPGLEPINSEQELPGLHCHVKWIDNRIYCNMTKVVDHDPTDPFSLTDAECEARRQMIRIVHFLQRKYYPTYMICSSGSKIGIREGRRIIGDYILKKQDILGEEPFDCPDGICVATSQIDFHSLTKPGHRGWRQRVLPYAIPFRCIIAKDFNNLLMAGKCISVDQVVHSSCRMTPTCCGMGQSAGTAVSMAIEDHVKNIRDISIEKLRQQLRTDGMELDPRKHKGYCGEESDVDEEEKGFQ